MVDDSSFITGLLGSRYPSRGRLHGGWPVPVYFRYSFSCAQCEKLRGKGGEDGVRSAQLIFLRKQVFLN